MMRVLLALDGSPCSDVAMQAFLEFPWPDGTRVKVLSVAYGVRFLPHPHLLEATTHSDAEEMQEVEQAKGIVAQAAETIRQQAPHLEVVTEVLAGAPKEVIVEHAETWLADLIWLGSHGWGAIKRTFFGSVAQSAANHAPCSVHIVRTNPETAQEEDRSQVEPPARWR